MTTIAYKDGIIAYDSRCLCGNAIVDDNIDKHLAIEGLHFFFSGNTGDQVALLEAYKSGKRS